MGIGINFPCSEHVLSFDAAAGTTYRIAVDGARIHSFHNPFEGRFGVQPPQEMPATSGPPTSPPPSGEVTPPANDSTPPTVAITAGPHEKTRQKTATFEFTGTDARAVASFQCGLDGGPFSSCTSPHTVKVKKGKHTFEVRATDQAGNVGTPASDSWKRKKK